MPRELQQFSQSSHLKARSTSEEYTPKPSRSTSIGNETSSAFEQHQSDSKGAQKFDSVPAEDPNNPSQWGICADTMKGHDEEMVHGWKEDIDTSLVFAGLFSAVLTGFVVESYPQLQPNPQDRTNFLLEQILQRLSDIQPSRSPVTTQIIVTAFKPTSSAVRLNAWWFSALVLSLFAGLIGLLAKQWLRAYLRQSFTSPRIAARLRQYRFNGLTKWGVHRIMGSVPVILELALVLFLLGLVEFLWALNSAVAGLITSIVSVALSFYAGTTVIPTFTASSPFKSPQAWLLCELVWIVIPRRLLSWTYDPRRSGGDYSDAVVADGNISLPGSWVERDIRFTRCLGRILEHDALVWTCTQTNDNDILEYVAPCASNLPPSLALSLAFETIARRADCTVPVLLKSLRNSGSRLYVEIFMARVGPHGTAGLTHMLLDQLPRMTFQHEHDLSQPSALDVLQVARKLITATERAACELRIHRQALDTLAWLTNGQVVFHVQRTALSLLYEMTQAECNLSYCPRDIENVADCALTALTRKDSESFIQACSVLMHRVPLGLAHAVPAATSADAWLHNLSRLLEATIWLGSAHRLAIAVRMKWCSGLATIARFDGIGAAGKDLMPLLETGIATGLVLYDVHEEKAMNELRSRYAS